MTKWEYLVFERPIQDMDKSFHDDLDRCGRAGWELVSVIEVSDHCNRSQRFYFKRPIEGAAEKTP